MNRVLTAAGRGLPEDDSGLKGLFVTLEGVHGCGKSTVGKLLMERLDAAGVDAEHAVDQQSTTISRELRRVNFDAEFGTVDSITEALLIAAARRQNVVEVLKPGLDHGKLVLCERFNDAFVAFQVYGRGLPSDVISMIGDFVADGLVPHLTILLDVDARVGLSRLPQHEKHRIEREPADFHQRVRDGYLAQAHGHPGRVKIVDAAQSVHAVFREVWALVEGLLSPRMAP